VDGHSYYSREVEEIRGFLGCTPGRFVFLIDEIFRGTNTTERIAIAASTIRYLAQKNIVLVTTHDVELQSLLAECARMFHFSEQVEGQRYYFDYVLRQGPCREGNAIRLIELKGYPRDIVNSCQVFASGKM
jgi:DNA mismatch repair ATPase MutS